ncbi:ABC transporter permease [Bacillus sp. REN10]|uniref:fluoroquinolone export ABC transporter permease subunit n=1 Tax=Bacillus sp. REN10 TaxID=2782541 RepID=UPI00193BD2B9|nr:ABC transporter permease [Bacillus sp. REN10]
MRLASALFYDIKLQFRHGLYFVYLLISHVYLLLLFQIPSSYRETANVLLTFSDPSMLGFFFIGGLVLLEKGQHIHDPLFVTPYKPEEYLLSKTLSLMLLSVTSSLYIHIMTFGFERSLFLFTIGVMLTSMIFTLIGLAVAVRCETVNEFFLQSVIYTTIFCLPLLSYTGIWDSNWMMWLPTHASLLLLHSVFEPISISDILYCIITLLGWATFSFWLAQRSFYQSIILKIGRERTW